MLFNKMKVLGQKLIYKGKYLKVFEREYLDKKKKKRVWECIERKMAVVIFALTRKKEVILEKIFRLPLNSYIIELPAGLVDKKGESPKKAAQRELLEETGYFARKLIPVFQWPLDSGLLTSQGILFFAKNVRFLGKRRTEDVEEIEVLKVSLTKLEDFLLQSSKKFKVDLRIFGALAILKKEKLI